MAYLSDTTKAGQYDLLGAMQDLAARGGPGIWHQIAAILALFVGRYKLQPEEYFTYSLYRKDRGRDFLRDFIANRRMRAFNGALLMPQRGIDLVTLNDKLATEALLSARGLPFSRTLAAYLPEAAQPPNLPGLTTLRTAADLVAYLSDPANLPVFGKPRADSFARGAAMIAGLAGPDRLRFLDGRQAPVADIAAEIKRDWKQGYLFQPFYTCDPGLKMHAGDAMASLRIVTLWTTAGIEAWYAVIRLPAKSAMHDGDAQDERIWGLVDLDDGRIIRLRSLRDPHAGDLRHGNDPTRPFLGEVLPHWQAALDLCRRGHESFPGHGMIGWDVFLTGQGAILNEANASPGHLYQVAAQRPLLNPDMRPAYSRALAFARLHGGGRTAF